MVTIRRLSRPMALGTVLVLLLVTVGLHPAVHGANAENHTTTSHRPNELEEFESALTDYVGDWFSRNSKDLIESAFVDRRPAGSANASTALSNFDRAVIKGVARFLGTAADVAQSRASAKAPESGRLFFFKGMKKLLWPVMIGLQIVKTVLVMMFLPSIIGSLGKIVGKAGLSSVSGLSHPAQTVDDLDFKDTTSYNADHDFGMNDGHGYLPSDGTLGREWQLDIQS
uniref:Uncharacterized protein n=1 Tax=Anopheles maculatus TaxID=74869 RepID=A0A182SJK3_9DIPT